MATHRSTPTGRRPPVLVVQTDEDPTLLARRLANAEASSIDLPHHREPLLPEHLERHARAQLAKDLPGRQAAHRQRETELAATVQAAAATHREAAQLTDATAERRKRLLDGAFWCEGKRALVGELTATLAAAETDAQAAAARLAEATAGIEAAADHEAATKAAIDQTQRQLLELDLSNRSESELRRALETAQQSSREASAVAADAERRTEDLRADLVAAEAEAHRLRSELTGVDEARAGDPTAVASSLRRLEDAPMVPADAASLRLADDLERLVAEVAALPPAPRGPSSADVDAAEAAVAAAREHLEALRRPLDPREPPPWWDELARLHAAVVDAEAAAGAGFRGKSGRKRFEEALAVERAFLVEIGYPSHLDALMSGGRRPAAARRGPLSIADAEQAVVEAEQRLFETRSGFNAAAGGRRLRSDLARVRALGGALLGLVGGQVTPDLLRRHRIDPGATAALWETLAVAGVTTRNGNAAETATAWLLRRQATDSQRAADAAEADAAEQRHDASAALVTRIEAELAEFVEAATSARRAVEVLEAELEERAQTTIDPAERAARADALRAEIAGLEATLGTLTAAADAAAAAARAAHTAAADRAGRIAAELAGSDTHALGLAGQLDAGTIDPADDLTDLGDLAAALRAEVSRLDIAISDCGRGVAGAAARLAAARAALAAHQATGPAEPSAADTAAAIAEILGSVERPTGVLVEPGLGFGPGGWEILLDVLIAVGAAAPVLVVTSNPDFAAWAVGQASRLVEVVPGRTIDPGPSAADRIDRAQTPS